MAGIKRPPSFNVGHEETTITKRRTRQTVDRVQQAAHLSNGLPEAEELERRPAHLLAIPQKLRDEIFNYLLTPNHSISINLFPYDEATRAFMVLSAPCKQTRDEPIDLFFKNTFVWTVCSVPHYSCEPHLHRMKRLELMLDSKLVCSTTLSGNELSVHWDQHISTLSIMSVTGGKVHMYPYDQRPLIGFESDFRRRHTLMEGFHRWIVQGFGMNISALTLLGDEVWAYG